MKKTLIVGTGLAGLSAILRLSEKEIAVKVVSQLNQPASSTVATGMYNPIVFRRVAKSWMVDVLLPEMHDFYADLEEKLGIKINSPITFKRRIPSSDYETMWNKRALDKDFHAYIDESEGDYANVKQAGIIDCGTLIKSFEAFALENNMLIDESFDHSALRLDAKPSYKGTDYDAIIFCEGPYAANNPLFNWLPFNICKGEWVIIETNEDLGTTAINNVVNIIPLGNHRYKLSSTYSWKELDWNTTETAEKELCAAFEEVFDCDYSVVERAAGLRPTVADRRPYLGEHPEHKGIYIFNGLGSKGVMLAPYFSKHLIEHIVDDKPLMAEVDIQRHVKRHWQQKGEQSQF